MIQILEALKQLRLKNIHPSIARVKILTCLINSASHPTVDQIYNSLLPEIPTLSKTTVYKTVDLLVESNLARLLQMEGHEARYDADISDHGHFICSRCGRIYDFTSDLDQLATEGLGGFLIEEKNVVFKGVCPRCLPE